jgi:hypothetical protein
METAEEEGAAKRGETRMKINGIYSLLRVTSLEPNELMHTQMQNGAENFDVFF